MGFDIIHHERVVHLEIDLTDRIEIDDIVDGFTRSANNLDLAPAARHALAFAWHGEPDHARLLAMARAIMRFAAPAGHREHPLFLMIDGDVGASLGRILQDELGFDGELVSIDGITLRELDFVDIGELLMPAGVVPVVIKSLLFGGQGARRHAGVPRPSAR